MFCWNIRAQSALRLRLLSSKVSMTLVAKPPHFPVRRPASPPRLPIHGFFVATRCGSRTSLSTWRTSRSVFAKVNFDEAEFCFAPRLFLSDSGFAPPEIPWRSASALSREVVWLEFGCLPSIKHLERPKFLAFDSNLVLIDPQLFSSPSVAAAQPFDEGVALAPRQVAPLESLRR